MDTGNENMVIKRRTAPITRIDAMKPDWDAVQPCHVLPGQPTGLHCTNPGAVDVHGRDLYQTENELKNLVSSLAWKRN